MYYFSRNSRKKVIHSADCHHIQNVAIEDVNSFETISDAYQQGYRFCRCCSPIVKKYRAERATIEDYCKGQAIYTLLTDKFIVVSTPGSKWKLMPIDGEECFALYHKNTLNRDDGSEEVPGYHRQRAKELSLSAYLKYIVSHEVYRMSHPLKYQPRKADQGSPRKGTKRYKRQQKREKRIAKRMAVRHVLDLIGNLHESPRTMA